MNVLLLQPPLDPERRYGAFAALGNFTAPQGLLYLAASLERAGHRACIVDLELAGDAWPGVLTRALDNRPDLVGLTATTPAVSTAAAVAARVKDRFPKVPVLLGGSHASALPERTLARFPSLDGAMVGESERTFPDLCDRLAAGVGLDALRGAPGTVLREGDDPEAGFVRGPPAELVDDLDELPRPHYAALAGFPDAYRPGINVARRLPAASLVSSRGCPFVCTFCAKSVFGRRVRSHSIEWIVDTMEALHREHGVLDVFFHDDLFFHDPERVASMAEEIIRRKLDMTWSCISRPEPLDRELLRLYRRGGCWQVSYGIESANPEVLGYIEKKTRLERIAEAVRRTSEVGIAVHGLFILGNPGDTLETTRETLALAHSLPLVTSQFSLFTPLPGSSSYDEFAAELGLDDRWDWLTTWNPVALPGGLSERTLRRLQAWFYLRTYLRPSMVARSFRSEASLTPSKALRGGLVLAKLAGRALA